MNEQTCYLDYAATTPVDPEVRQAMLPFLGEIYGNPSSTHRQGRLARRAVEAARRKVAALIGAEEEEVVFTSGGTEADVMAINGVLLAHQGKPAHVVTSAIEHPAVLECLSFWEARGVTVTTVKPQGNFVVDPKAIEEALRPETVLVTVMLVNNVVGTIQPVNRIAEIARSRGILVHTDAVQALAKIPVSVKELGVDLLSMSSHKIYGPKGVGALFIRSGLDLPSPGCGGGQEGNRRGGTENVPGIVGFGEAARLARAEFELRSERARALKEKLLTLRDTIPPVRVNGDLRQSVPHICNLCLIGVHTFRLVAELNEQGIFLSVGSACTSGVIKPSRVLKAGGLSDFAALCSVRISTGKDTTPEEVTQALSAISQAAPRLREAYGPEKLGQCDENCPCLFNGEPS